MYYCVEFGKLLRMHREKKKYKPKCLRKCAISATGALAILNEMYSSRSLGCLLSYASNVILI